MSKKNNMDLESDKTFQKSMEVLAKDVVFKGNATLFPSPVDHGIVEVEKLSEMLSLGHKSCRRNDMYFAMSNVLQHSLVWLLSCENKYSMPKAMLTKLRRRTYAILPVEDIGIASPELTIVAADSLKRIEKLIPKMNSNKKSLPDDVPFSSRPEKFDAGAYVEYVKAFLEITYQSVFAHKSYFIPDVKTAYWKVVHGQKLEGSEVLFNEFEELYQLIPLNYTKEQLSILGLNTLFNRFYTETAKGIRGLGNAIVIASEYIEERQKVSQRTNAFRTLFDCTNSIIDAHRFLYETMITHSRKEGCLHIFAVVSYLCIKPKTQPMGPLTFLSNDWKQNLSNILDMKPKEIPEWWKHVRDMHVVPKANGLVEFASGGNVKTNLLPLEEIAQDESLSKTDLKKAGVYLHELYNRRKEIEQVAQNVKKAEKGIRKEEILETKKRKIADIWGVSTRKKVRVKYSSTIQTLQDIFTDIRLATNSAGVVRPGFGTKDCGRRFFFKQAPFFRDFLVCDKLLTSLGFPTKNVHFMFLRSKVARTQQSQDSVQIDTVDDSIAYIICDYFEGEDVEKNVDKFFQHPTALLLYVQQLLALSALGIADLSLRNTMVKYQGNDCEVMLVDHMKILSRVGDCLDSKKIKKYGQHKQILKIWPQVKIEWKKRSESISSTTFKTILEEYPQKVVNICLERFENILSIVEKELRNI